MKIKECVMRIKHILIMTSLLFCDVFAEIEQKEIVVVIPSYNNSEWYLRNLDSVFTQDYENYRVIYIDDVSSDNTVQLVENYLIDCHLMDKCTLIKNDQRVGGLCNIYRAVHSLEDHVIVILLDGDDWLKHNGVFKLINETYQSRDIWLTYGQFEHYPSGQRGLCRDFPQVIIKKNRQRSYFWITSHLRTFYAGLFKRIKLDDLMDQDTFFMVTWDLAIMFPMLEMASERIKCIRDILYVYNLATPLNDCKLRIKEQARCENIIRGKAKYKRLASLNEIY